MGQTLQSDPLKEGGRLLEIHPWGNQSNPHIIPIICPVRDKTLIGAWVDKHDLKVLWVVVACLSFIACCSKVQQAIKLRLVSLLCRKMANSSDVHLCGMTPSLVSHTLHRNSKGLVMLQPLSCRHSRNLMWPIIFALFMLSWSNNYATTCLVDVGILLCNHYIMFNNCIPWQH